MPPYHSSTEDILATEFMSLGLTDTPKTSPKAPSSTLPVPPCPTPIATPDQSTPPTPADLAELANRTRNLRNQWAAIHYVYRGCRQHSLSAVHSLRITAYTDGNARQRRVAHKAASAKLKIRAAAAKEQAHNLHSNYDMLCRAITDPELAPLNAAEFVKSQLNKYERGLRAEEKIVARYCDKFGIRVRMAPLPGQM